MKARLKFDSIRHHGRDPQTGRHITSPAPAGTIIDHPDAYLWVRQGGADPVDEECRLAAGMTDAQMREATRHYEMVAKGIHPEDYEAYQAGAMTGYDDQGHWIPGPNLAAWLPEHGEPGEEASEEEPAATA